MMVSSRIFIVSIVVAVIVTASVTSAIFIYGPVGHGGKQIVSVNAYISAGTPPLAPYYAAQVEGYYLQNGLSVTLITSAGNLAAVQSVSTDKTSAAFAGDTDIIDMTIYAAGNPTPPPVVAVALTDRINPVGIIYLNSSGIKQPSDLAGKTIGTAYGSLSYQLLLYFLAKQGLSNKVTINNIALSAIVSALLAKKVDAIVSYAQNVAIVKPQAQATNDGVGIMPLASFNIPAQVDNVAVAKSLIQSSPDVVKEIVNATMSGYKFCVLNPEKCVRDYVQLNPGVDYNGALAAWQSVIPHVLGVNPAAVAKMTPLQLGWFDANQVSTAVAFAKQAYNLTASINPSDLYTNSFAQQP